MVTPSSSFEELLRENRRLREENHRLREENRALRAMIARLEQEVADLRGELAKLQEENEQLKARLEDEGKEDPPPPLKPPRRAGAEPKKKPGGKPGHPGSARPIPSQVDEEGELTLDCCPDCGSPLSEPQEERVRYVEDLLPPRLHVTKYRIKRYYCSNCRRLVERKPTEVLPGHRLGIRLMSWVVYLREELRLPVNLVQRYLEKAGLAVSQGEIEGICTEVADYLCPLYEGYRRELGEGEAANMDETGMRIAGENHWLWAGVRRDPETEVVVFHHDEHRSSAVAQGLLGEEFEGVVGCDFFSAYNPLGGRKQRCWAHLLRDTSKLKGRSEEGHYLHQCLKGLWERASSWVEHQQERAPPALREWCARRWEGELLRLARREWQDSGCQRIAKRLRKHWGELFTFVRHPGVGGTNNGVERALRPYVVKRKISGGHRSWKGARKHAILMSVLETCRRRGDDFQELITGVLREAAASAN